jgi:DNA-binding beta-propeller fold protein YncE
MATGEQVLVNQISPPRRSGTALFLWGILRLPVLVVVLYLLRNVIISIIESTVNYVGITEYAIALMSTPVARVVVFLGLVLALLVLWALTRRFLKPVIGYLVTMVAAGIILLAVFHLTRTSKLLSLPILLILATNLLPDPIINRVKGSRGWNWFMALGLGIAEVFFLGRYIEWLGSLIKGRLFSGRTASVIQMLPGVILASGIAAAALNFEQLVPLEQAIRMPPEVSIIDRGNFNWIELDPTGQYLYVTGHGLQYLQRYDMMQPSEPPLLSSAPVDSAQGFTYDPEAGEIYVFNNVTQTLLYLDATTLELKRSLLVTEVSPGDSWMTVDPHTDTITIVSEADIRIGTPFVVLNRTTGEILDQRDDLDASSILVHPDKPVLYLSFSRYNTNVMTYDLEQHVVSHQTPTDPRVDRMEYWEAANELLLASPVESRVIRFDADNLELKGTINANFGVRVIEVDPVRNLLLCGSLTTGTVAVFDLATGEQRGSFYLGPWLRTFALDPSTGTVYVSGNGALYKVNYGHLS